MKPEEIKQAEEYLVDALHKTNFLLFRKETIELKKTRKAIENLLIALKQIKPEVEK